MTFFSLWLSWPYWSSVWCGPYAVSAASQGHAVIRTRRHAAIQVAAGVRFPISAERSDSGLCAQSVRRVRGRIPDAMIPNFRF